MRASEGGRTEPSRRRFLQLAASTFGAVSTESLARGAGVGVANSGTGPEEVMRLNPAFRIRRTGGDKLEVFTHLPGGASIEHRFEGLEAALLDALHEARDVAYLAAVVADRYELTLEASTEEVRARLAELMEAGIVYRGDPITVKIARTHG